MSSSTVAAGKIIGDQERYRIESPVAVGAFSTVYRCTQLSSGRAFAIKVIDKKVAADKHMREALIREVNALEIAGSSPYVTMLVDKMVSKHNYYLVMELAEGGTLLDLIREQRQELRMLQASLSSCRDVTESLRSASTPFMQYDRVQHLFKQLLIALSTLHNRDVVHRDVKPENILLNRRRTRLVLSDFGFACHAPPGTELHRACGTLRYCAPELLHENPRYDGRKVDVWAAGVTLYVMLFGGHPFRCSSQDPDTLLEVILTTRYRIPRPIPTDVEDMLQHMLCVDPVQRWSVKQLLQHPWMAQLGMDMRSPTVRSTSAKRSFVYSESPSTLPTGPLDAAESVVEMLSEDCPPLDAIPSDEDLVDDGFYQSSNDDKQSSMCSTGPTQSAVSTQMPTSSMPDSQTPCVVSAVATEVAAAAAAPPPPSAAPAKREVLRQGSVSTSMVSIESCADTDNDADENQARAAAEGAADGSSRYFLHRRAHHDTSDGASSRSANSTCYDEGAMERWWVRYTYGLYLTTRILARFVGFVVVCVVAIAVRVVLRREIVDLPLPEVVRSHICYLLFTPLRCSTPAAHQLHLSSSDEQQRQPPSPSSPLSATQNGASPSPLLEQPTGARLSCLCGALPNADTYPSRQANLPPIPGSGLRRYVRTADQLMRDSFVGNVVREQNASLTDPQPSLIALPSQEFSGTSSTSSPAAPSLATIAPAPLSHLSVDRLFSASQMGAQSSVGEQRDSRRNSATQHTTAQGVVATDGEAGGAALREGTEGAAILSTPPSGAPIVTPATVVESPAPTQPERRVSASGRVNSKHVGSQEGATDTTESGDSGGEKQADATVHHQHMLSPGAPMLCIFPGHLQRSEDFPLAKDIPAVMQRRDNRQAV